MDQKTLFEEVENILIPSSRLIRLPPEGNVVFVGDTHGDLDASKQVLGHYLQKRCRVVFLGDYIDRGRHSEENINYLLQMKLQHPEEIVLLAGNHEGQMVKELRPANFWESLSIQKKKKYGRIFSTLPLCATSANGLVALHGALPELNSLEEIDQIKWGDSHWDRIVWGDFNEGEGDLLGNPWGRPQFGGGYFKRLMERYRKKVLIRSHQPHAPSLMFEKRCITIFTSNAYPLFRTIVIVDLGKEIRDARDVIIERI